MFSCLGSVAPGARVQCGTCASRTSLLSPRGGLCLTDASSLPDCCRWWDDESAAVCRGAGLALSMGVHMLEDLDPAETREWVDALDSVMTFEGADRASFLLD